jgi:hypothetical protein
MEPVLNFGFTYSPNLEKVYAQGLRRFRQTVFRGGFSMASVREGTNTFWVLLVRMLYQLSL